LLLQLEMLRRLANLSKPVVVGAHPVNPAHAREGGWAWLALVAALVGSGCGDGDDCAPECVGNMLQTCSSGSYGSYPTQRPCNGTCVVDPTTTEPFCALDDKPDLICAGLVQRRCDDTTVVSCHAGYATERLDCAGEGASLGLEPGPDGTITCLDSPFATDAECGVAWKPDPSCDARSEVSYFCDGDVRVDCYGRYPVRRQACSANQVCDTTCKR